MAKNKLKKILTAVTAVIFALCISYFAVLPPTAAWFYVSFYSGENKFVIGTLELEPDTYIEEADIVIPAATKLEDPEEIEFDRALHIETIEAENTGSLPARVYVEITKPANADELYYFLYSDSDYDAAADAIDPNRSTSVMDIIRTRKGQYSGLDANIITDGDATATYEALEIYNHGAPGVAADQGNYVVVPPKTKLQIHLAFWVDYNIVGETLEDTSVVDDHYSYEGVEIVFIAGLDSDGWYPVIP
ncbi:MAG: hypothetical protein GX345_08875 [Clostridiales bacterium]|mgnify:CR=1 FL=1|nr:hypothetical protein [Clostridiales bacterium]